MRARVGCPGFVERRAGQLVNRVQRSVPRRAPLEGPRGHFGGGPVTASASRLVLDDRASERVGEPLRPPNKGNSEQRAQAGEGLASSQ